MTVSTDAGTGASAGSGPWQRDPLGYADELLEPCSRVHIVLLHGQVFNTTAYVALQRVPANAELQQEMVVREVNPYGICVLLREGWRAPGAPGYPKWHLHASLRFYPWPTIAYIEPDTRTGVWR